MAKQPMATFLLLYMFKLKQALAWKVAFWQVIILTNDLVRYYATYQLKQDHGKVNLVINGGAGAHAVSLHTNTKRFSPLRAYDLLSNH
jgi:hypothetical protein